MECTSQSVTNSWRQSVYCWRVGKKCCMFNFSRRNHIFSILQGYTHGAQTGSLSVRLELYARVVWHLDWKKSERTRSVFSALDTIPTTSNANGELASSVDATNRRPALLVYRSHFLRTRPFYMPSRKSGAGQLMLLRITAGIRKAVFLSIGASYAR